RPQLSVAFWMSARFCHTDDMLREGTRPTVPCTGVVGRVPDLADFLRFTRRHLHSGHGRPISLWDGRVLADQFLGLKLSPEISWNPFVENVEVLVDAIRDSCAWNDGGDGRMSQCELGRGCFQGDPMPRRNGVQTTRQS